MASVLCLLAYLILIPTINSSYSPCATVQGYKYYNSYCYRLSDHKATWEEAELYCQQDGGHLTSIHDEAELHFFLQLFNGFRLDRLWIGGVKQQDGNWAWTDETAMIFTSWDYNKPDAIGDCISVGTNSRWVNQKCTYFEFRFICKIRSPAVTFHEIHPSSNQVTEEAQLLSRVTASTQIDCARSCKSDSTCMSFTTTKADGGFLCELFSFAAKSSEQGEGKTFVKL